MRRFVFTFITLLFSALLLAPSAFAAASPAVLDQRATAPAACVTGETRLQVAQLACCRANKGVCGCRAGKIVCCDNTVSKEPGCTCHRDEGIVE